MKNILILLILSVGFQFAAFGAERQTVRDNVVAKFVERLDLKAGLEAPEWKNAPAYRFRRTIREVTDFGYTPCEEATVKFLHDGKNLYVGAVLRDSDILTEATENRTALERFGDHFNVFVKPENQPDYWEFQCAPNGFVASFHVAGGGRNNLPSAKNDAGIAVAAAVAVDGTLNNSADVDKAWSVVMSIPLNTLSPERVTDWTILVGRSNFSRYLTRREASGYPQPLRGWFEFDMYGTLRLEK